MMGRASQSTAYIRPKPFESTLNYFGKRGITKHLKQSLVVRLIMVAAMLWSHDQRLLAVYEQNFVKLGVSMKSNPFEKEVCLVVLSVNL